MVGTNLKGLKECRTILNLGTPTTPVVLIDSALEVLPVLCTLNSIIVEVLRWSLYLDTFPCVS